MTIATVDAFQGMEHEVIIVSVDCARELLVRRRPVRRAPPQPAPPRRGDGLVLVGHGATLRATLYDPLLRYMWREGG